ncbi:hypothetical protein ACQPW1_24610 [Nocardia sp. CA-128927]|uniref:hypothetical protein n=1 Tax=Nocardia sp. CA-128927 TaxID=3239975 RepID=UPI003D952688
MEVFLIAFAIGMVGIFASWAISVEAFFTFAIIYMVGLLVAGWVLSIAARRHVILVAPGPPDVVAEAVARHFKGAGWRAVQGKGDLNFQARGIGLNSYGMEHPVLSIDLVDRQDGSTGVEIWMSEWTRRFGVTACCDRVISKRWRLARKLARLDDVAGVTY